MYNTHFKVKYNDIEEELIGKLNNKTEHFDEEDYDYTHQDVLDICNKLYHDELLSVFNVECITENNVEDVMKYVYDMTKLNANFTLIIDEISQNYIKEFITKEENITDKQENIKDKEENIRQISLIFLFSKDVFYITHKCICQQIDLGTIDNELLVDLQKKSENVLKQL
jgi:hypothetical protein